MNEFWIFCRGQKIARSHEFSGFQVPRDIEHGFALTHGERLLVNVPVGYLPEDVVARNRVVEKIFASLQSARRMAPRVNLKCGRAANHAVLLQKPRHRAAGCAVRKIDEYPTRRKCPVRPLDGNPQPPRNSGGDDQQQQYKFSEGFQVRCVSPLLGSGFARDPKKLDASPRDLLSL
jgi:hypothetical protein